MSLTYLGLFGLGSAAMMIFGISFIREAQLTKDWPIAQGELLSTRTRVQRSSTGNNASTSSRRYTYEVTYAYEVERERYHGDLFLPGL